MSASPPRVTVAIPSYNGAPFIGEAIASVLAQTFTDFELLIVDDASQDETIAVIRQFDDPRICLRQNPRRLGLVGNWNACLRQARGEYLCLFHHDDRMRPRFLERCVGVLEQHPCVGYVFTAARWMDEQGKTIYKYYPPQQDWVRNGQEFFQELVCGNSIIASGVVVRRAAYERVGAFDARLRYSVDWEMWLRLARHFDVGFLAEPLVERREHARTESRQFFGVAGRDLREQLAALRIAFDTLPREARELRSSYRMARQAAAARALQMARHLLVRVSRYKARPYVRLALRIQPSLVLRREVRRLLAATFTYRRAAAPAAFYRARLNGAALPSQVEREAQFYVPVELLNASNAVFPGKDSLMPRLIYLAYHWYDAHGAPVIYDGLRTPLPCDLAPGASARLDALVVAPSEAGDYVFEWDLVDEDVTWFSAFARVATPQRVRVV